MSGKGFIEAMNRHTVTAIVRLVNLIFPPLISYIGLVFIGKANTIIENQVKFEKTFEVHSAAIDNLRQDGIKLQRFDRLFGVKQEAMRDALQVNSTIGKEFIFEYDIKYNDKLNESNFLNP